GGADPRRAREGRRRPSAPGERDATSGERVRDDAAVLPPRGRVRGDGRRATGDGVIVIGGVIDVAVVTATAPSVSFESVVSARLTVSLLELGESFPGSYFSSKSDDRPRRDRPAHDLPGAGRAMDPNSSIQSGVELDETITGSYFSYNSETNVEIAPPPGPQPRGRRGSPFSGLGIGAASDGGQSRISTIDRFRGLHGLFWGPVP
ncbi:hypothetical protein THAOC_19575, partial [Thalassiosira oceanica]